MDERSALTARPVEGGLAPGHGTTVISVLWSPQFATEAGETAPEPPGGSEVPELGLTTVNWYQGTSKATGREPLPVSVRPHESRTTTLATVRLVLVLLAR